MAIGAVIVTPETSYYFGLYEPVGGALARRGAVGPVVTDDAGASTLRADITRENPGRTVLAFKYDRGIMRWKPWA